MKEETSTPSTRKTSKRMRCVNPDAAGIDLGSRSHYVALPPGRGKVEVRQFGCFTCDLEDMAAWLAEHKITTVAMEATGVYWVPVYQILEHRGFKVVLVNAKHYKNAPGRKTDVQDCQWLQHLHEVGLLTGSFRPEEAICVVRSYVRQRDTLVEESSRHIQRMQKALEQMNIQLHKVLSDITGETGMTIIKAIVAGERDPLQLAKLRNYRVHASIDTIVQALTGDWREEHLFCLAQEVALYEFLQGRIGDCEAQMEARWKAFASKADPDHVPPAKSKKTGAPLRIELFRITGVDATALEGLGLQNVQQIISEVGLDVSAWPTEKNFASWLNLCPRPGITGGKVKRNGKTPAKNRAADAFRNAASTLANSKTATGAYYRRMRARKGGSYAVEATAHKLSRQYYAMIKHGQSYVAQGVNYYEEKYRAGVIKGAVKKLQSLGFDVAITENQALTGAVP